MNKEEKMKRVLLSVLMICLLVGQASAEMYTLDYATALDFRQLPADGSSGTLMGVFNDIEQVYVFAPEGFPEEMVVSQYEEAMQGEVGFVGFLSGNLSWMRIGLLEDDFGTYSGFRTFLANDNENTWDVRLVANGVPDDEWVPIAAGESRWLELPFNSTGLTMIGFDVRLNTGVFNPPSITDWTHISVVPLQGGVILGILGLAAAGWRLRKLV